MTLLWWHWLVLGLILMVGELVTPGGFYILFFGVGAVLTGIATLAGVESTTVQILLATIFSVAGLVLFRARVLRWMQRDPQSPAVDSVVGEVGTTLDALTPGGIGKVELRGTPWTARNASDVVLAADTRCRVTGIDGLLLLVGPERSDA